MYFSTVAAINEMHVEREIQTLGLHPQELTGNLFLVHRGSGVIHHSISAHSRLSMTLRPRFPVV